MIGTGFFPLGREEAYSITADELFLIGTSEVPLVSMHCDDALDAGPPPAQVRRHLAVLPPRGGRARQGHARPLPRAPVHEGRAGRLLRARRGASPRSIHYELLGNAEAILAKLEIPYRVAIACTGEIGLGQTRKHEVESWMPGRNAYSETHSCSTLGDFQARRSNIRVRTADGTLGVPLHAEQHRHRQPAHPHPAPREPPERRRQRHPPQGPRPLPQRQNPSRPSLAVTRTEGEPPGRQRRQEEDFRRREERDGISGASAA